MAGKVAGKVGYKEAGKVGCMEEDDKGEDDKGEASDWEPDRPLHGLFGHDYQR